MSRSADPFRARPARDVGDTPGVPADETPEPRDDATGPLGQDPNLAGGQGRDGSEGDAPGREGSDDAPNRDNDRGEPAESAEPGEGPDDDAPGPEARDEAQGDVEPIPSHSALEQLRKADLQALCTRHHVDYATDDTRPELIAHLDQARDTTTA